MRSISRLVLAAAIVGSGCNSQRPIPVLATWDPTTSVTFTESSSGEGSLDVVGRCVRLVLDNGKVLLPVWPVPSSWDPATGTIRAVDVLGKITVLRDAERISLGGASGVPEYVSPPDPDCAGDETFVVNTVRVEGG